MSIGGMDNLSYLCSLLTYGQTCVIGSSCYLVGISDGKCIGYVMHRSEPATGSSGYCVTARTEAFF